ncbi:MULTISPECIES: tetrahydrofolate dehydrogenase/cyclohydrolase catalytic domain-containing protein [unclassified Paracoccus (in: a-proteobacteria)]|uniref:tetrahydrofolate dehydrogenase/cyclohydrolase catalytic domain-containing protein n=1 Tax=unclassified Paracoccus (in: a-proteobacteria) TaxID=2688777 RepID=UPI00160427E0|nr:MULTISPECIES: tetrahydrofolate dehydrogenase/cyclohydrolase catalytic domain-containing protein [unclassified Paracoccus (in: a-proteobacteria)]MBB1492917.1 hypothetical protein [Paracoccus sp. MC1854]MBB1499599.1 hypothetical protein [Paracoccus sp. MC1862]QQO44985.1 hypothetical protein JGR78_00740 [Paracoccus sp. MC1862]
MVEPLKGKAFASSITRSVAQRVTALPGSAPKLAVVLVGNDAASEIRCSQKDPQLPRGWHCSLHHRLPAKAMQAEVAELLSEMNPDPDVAGVLLQLPLPAHLDVMG